MDAYLQTCAVSKSVRDLVWTKCRPLSASETVRTTAMLFEAIGIDSQFALGDEYGKIGDGEIVGDYVPVLSGSDQDSLSVLPLLWLSSLAMCAYVDCGMHLIFHGVVAYCVAQMEEFIKDHGLTQQFERLANHYFQDT